MSIWTWLWILLMGTNALLQSWLVLADPEKALTHIICCLVWLFAFICGGMALRKKGKAK